jgi:hypothetical protein
MGVSIRKPELPRPVLVSGRRVNLSQKSWRTTPCSRPSHVSRPPRDKRKNLASVRKLCALLGPVLQRQSVGADQPEIPAPASQSIQRGSLDQGRGSEWSVSMPHRARLRERSRRAAPESSNGTP